MCVNLEVAATARNAAFMLAVLGLGDVAVHCGAASPLTPLETRLDSGTRGRSTVRMASTGATIRRSPIALDLRGSRTHPTLKGSAEFIRVLEGPSGVELPTVTRE